MSFSTCWAAVSFYVQSCSSAQDNHSSDRSGRVKSKSRRCMCLHGGFDLASVGVTLVRVQVAVGYGDRS